MAVEDTEGYWDIVVSSLQDICGTRESASFEEIFKDHDDAKLAKLSKQELEALKEEIRDHVHNLGTAKRLIETLQQNLKMVIDESEKQQQQEQQQQEEEKGHSRAADKKNSRGGSRKGNSKQGRLYWVTKFDSLTPIVVGSEVAYKLRNRHFEEWIQCEVLKILAEGTKFEVRDPEPDENNNPGQTFKATYKEILPIPTILEVPNLLPYPTGSKVLARYPETTTFYPAAVAGTKKDGTVRLKFEGEDEVNKETEVGRRLVLPFPAR